MRVRDAELDAATAQGESGSAAATLATIQSASTKRRANAPSGRRGARRAFGQ